MNKTEKNEWKNKMIALFCEHKPLTNDPDVDAFTYEVCVNGYTWDLEGVAEAIEDMILDSQKQPSTTKSKKPFQKRYNENYNGTLNHHIRGMRKKDMELFKVIKKFLQKDKDEKLLDSDVQRTIMDFYYQKHRGFLKKEFDNLKKRPFTKENHYE